MVTPVRNHLLILCMSGEIKWEHGASSLNN